MSGSSKPKRTGATAGGTLIVLSVFAAIGAHMVNIFTIALFIIGCLLLLFAYRKG